MKKKTRNIKNNKHNKIVKDYDKQKENHLEKLANKLLKADEKNQRLKDKYIDKDFLNLF
tara:strand:- start:282 stop:458 length:177 start_codon:yes stop_codon:yes gene_type:complete